MTVQQRRWESAIGQRLVYANDGSVGSSARVLVSGRLVSATRYGHRAEAAIFR